MRRVISAAIAFLCVAVTNCYAQTLTKAQTAQTIEATIVANGQRQITGPILQTNLLDILAVAASWQGTWATDISYSAGEIVSYNGETWVGDAPVAGDAPGTVSGQWSLLSQCATFTATTSGCVPASGGSSSEFLSANGTWAVPSGGGGGSGNVVGSGSSVVGHLPSLNNTSTTAIVDSGVVASSVVTGSSTSVVGNIPSFNNTTTTGIVDSGIPATFAAIHGKTCYVDGVQYSTIASALSASCQTIYVTLSGTSVTSPLTISGNNVSIICPSQIAINVSSGATITLSGDFDMVKGCYWRGPGTSVANAGAAFVITGSWIWFDGNNVNNFGHVGAGFSGSGSRLDEIQETAGQYHWITNNYVVANADKALTQESFTANPLQYTYVTNNVLEGVDIDNTNTASISHSIMSNNVWLAGAHSSSDDECIWSGGTPATEDGQWSHNNCILLQSLTGINGNGDAVSMGSNNDFTFDHNNIYGGGNCANQVLEFNSGFRGHIDSNNLYTTNPGCTSNGAGINGENLNNVTINDNVIWGFPSGGQAILVVSGAVSAVCPSGCSVIDVTVNNNVIFFITGDTGSSSGGILFENSNSQQMNAVQAVGDLIQGTNDAAGTFGVQVSPNSLTMQGVLIGPLSINNLPLGVDVFSGTTNYCYVAGGNYASTPTSGVTSTCH